MNGIIYKATNKINGKIYIGQTFRGFEKRKYEHIRKSISGEYQTIFAKAIVKYGEHNFEWEVIDEASSQDELNEKEIYWISFYNTNRNKNGHGYNMTEGGEGVRGILISEETRNKMSESHKGKKLPDNVKKKISLANKGKLAGNNHPMYNKKFSKERREKISKSLKGRRLSEETKRKMSIAHRGKVMSKEHLEKLAKTRVGERNGMYGKTHSKHTKKKISDANKGRLAGDKNPSAKSVVKLTKEGEFIEKYSTAKYGALSVNGDTSAIIKCCRGKRNTHKGFKWMYEEDYLASEGVANVRLKGN